MDISTFSKANKVRGLELFQELYQEVLRLVKQKSQLGKNQQQAVNDYEVCPIDSTVITLTSKL